MHQSENIGKYKKAVLEDPHAANHESSQEAKFIFDVLMNKAQWLDAIDTEDKGALDELFQNIKKKHQKWLSDLVMHSKVFKYYALMHLGRLHGYFWAKNNRTKEFDKKIESLLRSQWYVAKDMAKIFASKRYEGSLEEHLEYRSRKWLDVDSISTAIVEAAEYLEKEAFTIDEKLTELVEERSMGNKDEKEFLPEKIPFLREWLLS